MCELHLQLKLQTQQKIRKLSHSNSQLYLNYVSKLTLIAIVDCNGKSTEQIFHVEFKHIKKKYGLLCTQKNYLKKSIFLFWGKIETD